MLQDDFVSENRVRWVVCFGQRRPPKQERLHRERRDSERRRSELDRWRHRPAGSELTTVAFLWLLLLIAGHGGDWRGDGAPFRFSVVAMETILVTRTVVRWLL